MARFLLTAGSNRAPSVPILGEALLALGHEISAVLVVSPWQIARIRAAVRQRGLQWLVQRAGVRSGGQQVLDELHQLGLVYPRARGRIGSWARDRGVPVLRLRDLNDASTVERVRAIEPDAVIYGGGGILRKPFLDAAGRVLNAHAGPLPEIRGMNAAEWTLLLGQRLEVTIHLIDVGIDTGPVLLRVPYSREGLASIEQLRSRAVVAGLEGLIRVIAEELWSSAGRRSAQSGAHRQCFVMAPVLRERIASRLRRA